MDRLKIKKIAIVGGGTAGWMAAAALGRLFEGKIAITLVESDEIGTVGVGEATIPQIRLFNSTLGIDENEFVKKTQGTFKLGIQFVDWWKPGHSYLHAFGPVGGKDLGTVQFYQYWLKLHKLGLVDDLDQFVFNSIAARDQKFMRSVDVPDSPLANIFYAFHFDASLYAKYLRGFSEAKGVRRIEGKVQSVQQHPETGFLESVQLESGERVEADLFLDCSGFRGLLIEQCLQTGYEDWSEYLPANRAWAVPCVGPKNPTPYTRATAREAGWQWRIPLQHRIGNGYVYCNQYISDEAARTSLLNNLDGEALAEPRQIKFLTGMRKQFWNKNCIAMGLSSGFLEPLESTSIHFIQSAIAKLVSFFPDKGFDPVDIAEYNRQCQFEYVRSRDFLVLHYIANARVGQPFWDHVRSMPIPGTLAHKLDLFKSSGRFFRENDELFAESSWVQVFLGQGVMPGRYHPLVDAVSTENNLKMIQGVHDVLRNSSKAMPTHQQFIDKYCLA